MVDMVINQKEVTTKPIQPSKQFIRKIPKMSEVVPSKQMTPKKYGTSINIESDENNQNTKTLSESKEAIS